MDVSSFVLLSHEQALRRRLDVTANNMANTSTVGFKREQPLFHEYVEKTKEAPVEDAKKTSFVLDYGAVHDASQGAFQATGNPLDVMIDGPGYINVEAPGGGVAYTRAGFIKILETGDLATSGGQRILDENGRAINVPDDQKTMVTIAGDGTVMGRDGPLGRIAITTFDEINVSPRGDGLMEGTRGRVLTAREARLKIGGVEASNVQPIVETTTMIDILRSYQTSMRMTESLNDMRKQAIDKLGRVN
ncbi:MULTISPECIES: flagellar hook-basal body complex protein [Sphingomonadales]|uniref:Flagellar biosynthesis protein FlgF n=2 Tax=Edaphosphingomonas TaxID=3423724 RepID=A0A2T4HPF0_9SPHN|nr:MULTISPECIES: flagellar hook-basal body complex protein [Sphingomonas]AGH49091.1 flagellar basal-body rod protein FlgF [Sphingomonas sp. MM-1]MDX3883679.1 flagellar hook-basal body complex protein [Sphingomonas sp.]OHT21512.1 Flagellar basal-body rod protein FlgG [Sphingomonas haloaromaticamans]PTD17683.1 flagellar biosynthesis protein FlgF [Sphingomonas fennica]